MKKNVLVQVENVSKKYCRSLKRSMIYGISDITRNAIGLSSKSHKLRKNEFWALDNISFELKKGEVLGIIGPNGSGKSTLLKLLNGIFWPDKGQIIVKGRTGALIEVGAGFHPLLTGRENIFLNGAILGMSKEEITKKFDEIVEFAGIGDFLDSPVKHYSSGMFVRLGFAIVVHSEPDVLLVDEILAVGDSGFQTKCFNRIGKLKDDGTSTILVSHNMHTISNFSDKVIFLNKNKVEYFDKVADGIMEYINLFVDKGSLGLEKICSGNDKIKFFNVKIEKKVFYPGDSFSISMQYTSLIDYRDVDIDTGIYCGNEKSLYFQAGNKAYKKKIDLKKGSHSMKIEIENIQINNSMAKIAISIWSKNRIEYLFWWRIPVEFKGMNYSNGKNFLNVSYSIE